MSSTRAKDVANSEETRNRPFDPKVVEQAAALAARYHIQIRRDRNGYAGTVGALPSILGHGKSKAAAINATRDLLKWSLAYLIETGRAPTPNA